MDPDAYLIDEVRGVQQHRVRVNAAHQRRVRTPLVHDGGANPVGAWSDGERDAHATGISARTVVPLLGRLSTWRRPPSAPTRSARPVRREPLVGWAPPTLSSLT